MQPKMKRRKHEIVQCENFRRMKNLSRNLRCYHVTRDIIIVFELLDNLALIFKATN